MKVKEWSENEDTSDSKYRLIMDLDMSFSCCELLNNKLEQILKGLKHTSEL